MELLLQVVNVMRVFIENVLCCECRRAVGRPRPQPVLIQANRLFRAEGLARLDLEGFAEHVRSNESTEKTRDHRLKKKRPAPSVPLTCDVRCML